MLIILDHTYAKWSGRYNNHTYTNGAYTYSKEIVKWQVPIWEKVFKDKQYDTRKNILLSTVHQIEDGDVPPGTELIIQYLHRYPYGYELMDVERVLRVAKGVPVVFIVAYKEMEIKIDIAGHHSYWLPMSVDVELVNTCKAEPLYTDKRIIYFGNLLHAKDRSFDPLKRQLNQLGWTVDWIDNNWLNLDRKHFENQEEIWRELAKYQYGIGVGRCALEMYALGMQVLIYGKKMGGIVTDMGDWSDQLETNFNGRYWTHTANIAEAMVALPNTLIRTHTPQDVLRRVHEIADIVTVSL